MQCYAQGLNCLYSNLVFYCYINLTLTIPIATAGIKSFTSWRLKLSPSPSSCLSIAGGKMSGDITSLSVEFFELVPTKQEKKSNINKGKEWMSLISPQIFSLHSENISIGETQR